MVIGSISVFPSRSNGALSWLVTVYVFESEPVLARDGRFVARGIEDGCEGTDPGLEPNVEPVHADAYLLEFAPAARGHLVVGIRCDEALHVRAERAVVHEHLIE
jgi:hypothetical protein